MHTFSLVAGSLGLVCFALAVPLNGVAVPALGLVLSLIALVTGVLNRRHKQGMAGLALGVIGIVVAGLGSLYLNFGTRTGGGEQPGSVSPPR